MTIKVADGGQWKTISALRFPYPDIDDQTPAVPRTWYNPSKVRVADGGVWVDTGYVPVAGPPGTPYMVSGTPTSVTISWRHATQQPTPDEYTAILYTQAGVKVATAKLPASAFTNRTRLSPTPSVTFGASAPRATYQVDVYPPPTTFHLTPDTNYYVTVTGSGSGMLPVTSAPLRIRTGHDRVTRQVAVSGWLDEDTTVSPVAGVATSTYAGFPITNVTDKGLPGTSGVLAPFSSGWVSKARSAQRSTTRPNDLWEGLDFTMPSGPRRRLTEIRVVCDEPHNVYLGVKVGNDWKGTLTASGIGISSTTYPSVLNHDYLASNIDHTTNVKRFKVLAYGDWEFSEVQRFCLAFNNFVNIYGTSSTTGTWSAGTSTPVTLPPNTIMRLDATRKKVYLANSVTGAEFTHPDTGARYLLTPNPAAYSPVWQNGSTAQGLYGYKLALSNNVLYFRVMDPFGNPDYYPDGNPYLRRTSTSGPIIALKMTDLFTPAVLGTTTSPPTYVSGTKTTPAWRARVLDVALTYQVWGPTGKYETVVITPAAATVAGPTAW